jgi:hypothetical protein
VVCLASFMLMLQFPVIHLTRAILLFIVFWPLAILGLLISGWNYFKHVERTAQSEANDKPSVEPIKPSFAQKSRSFIIIILFFGILAILWFTWDMPTVSNKEKHFIRSSDGLVIDQKTGLEWYTGPKSVDWNQANEWVKGLDLNGGGFRLPSLGELKGIFQKGAGTFNSNPDLGIQQTQVWSSETKRSILAKYCHLSSTPRAGYFTFSNGKSTWNQIGPGHCGQVLAVRNTKSK